MASEPWRKVVFPRLLRMALPLARAARLEAKDLAQMALVRVYAVATRGEGAAWDVDHVEEFLKHMLAVMKSERSHALTRGYVKRHVHESDRDPPGEEADGPEEPFVERAPHPDGTAEDVLAAERRLRRAEDNADTILARLDPLAQQVFRELLVEPRLWDPQAFAERNGVEIGKVYAARRDVARHTATVMESAPDSERGPSSENADG